MKITCPSCDTSYTIPDDKIGAKGRSVRCASCATKWHVSLSDGADQDGSVETGNVRASDAELDDVFASAGAGETDAVEQVELPAQPVPIASLRLPLGETGTPATSEPQTPEQIAADEEKARDIAAEVAELNKRKDIESYAKKPKIKVSKKKPVKPRKPFKFDLDRFLVRARPIFGAFVLLTAIGVIAASVVFRVAVVSAFPNLASLYEKIGMPVNLRGLVFQKVEMLREVENSQQVLVVEGELDNPTTEERPVPAIRFALRGDDQQEIYAWSIEPKTTMLTPGANMRFRTRLAAPPEQASDIQVRMIERRNRQASAP